MAAVMATPRTVDLELTSRCNLRCQYCYYLGNEGVVYEDLPTERWLALFDELGAARVMDVCLSGGEALLRPDFFELLDALVRNRLRFQLLTNGTTVTAEVARRLKATGRCNTVQVSLDGPRPESHEALRGPGTFAPAVEAIRTLRDAGLPVTVRCTVHARNIDDLPELARLLLDELGLPAFSTNAISSLGSLAKYGDDLFLPAGERLRAMQVLAALEGQYPGRISASAGPLAEWRLFHDMERARRSGATLANRGRLTGCGCIFSRIAVRADGAYVPCVMLPQLVLGRVGVDPLVEVWRSAPFHALRQRIHTPLSSFPRCSGCPYVELCTGNCAGTALSESGDANQPGLEGCLLLFQQALAREGLAFDFAELEAATTTCPPEHCS